MARQSRLRVQKSKTHRRILFFVLLVSAVAVAVWLTNKEYQVIDYINEVISTVKKNSPADGISRGTIYDRNLKQMAVSMARVSVYVRIKEIESISKTVKELEAIFQVDAERLQKKLETGSLRVWVAEDINLDQEQAIKEIQLPGVYLQRERVRFYPNDSTAAHLIGYVDDNIGLAGVEFYYDRVLAGREIEEKAGSGSLNYSQDLVLTVDLKIQKILEELVVDIGKDQDAVKVAAYVMDGAAGEVVGAAQYPGFNPNDFTRYSSDVLENIFLKQTVIPDKFRILLGDAANVYRGIEAGGMTLPWSIQALETDLGSQLRLWDWLGLTEQWSTDFSAYYYADKKRVTAYRPVVHSQRQSHGLVPEYATPLKILTAMARMFSSGNKIRPHAVAAVSDAEPGKVYNLNRNRIEAGGGNETIEKGADEIEWLLRSQAVPGPSGTLFFGDKNLMAAPSPEGRKFLTNEMMFVMIPADTSTLKMLAVIEGLPQLPLAKKKLKNNYLQQRIGQIVERISVLQQIGKNVSDVVEVEQPKGGNYPLKKDADSLVSGNIDTPEIRAKAIAKMPDLKGLSLRKSFQLLQDRNLKIRFQGTGRVVSQKPPPGTLLQGVSECTLVLEKAEDMHIEKMIETAP